MKFKAARASLAATLTASLFMSLLPLAFAESTASQPQQDANASRPRRGKNGEPVTTSSNDKNAAQSRQDSGQGSKADAAKPDVTKPDVSKPASSSDTSAQKPAAPIEKSAQDGSQRARTSPEESSVGAQPQPDAPAFDRPPLGSQGRRGAEGPARSGQPAGASQRSTYSRGDSGGRSASTSTPIGRDRSSESSGAARVDPETERSTSGPPVLKRSTDSPSGGGGDATRSTARPPVPHRPTDPQPSDDVRSPDVNVRRPSTSGQQQGGPGQQSSEGDEVVKLESTLVSIPLLVSDRSGRYVPQLSARDFTLYEDGVPQKIASFGSEEVPFNVALLLDVSPSVQGSERDIQDAAIAFVRQLRDQDRVMVASFDRHIHYLCDFTSDRRELEWAIRRATTGQGTSVYDAVYETVERKLRNIDGRKALILFSDGEDTTSSRASYDDAVNLVSESDVLVYGLRYPGTGGGRSVGIDPWPRRSPVPRIQLPFPFPFPWPTPRRRGPFKLTDTNSGGSPSPQSWPRRRGGSGSGDFMKDITAAGGGPVYDAERIGDLSTLAHRIAEELRHVYVLSYYPTNPLSKGGYRRVRISLNRSTDLALRHRPGYNARPDGRAKPTI